MLEFIDYPAVRPSLIEQVVLVDRLERSRRGLEFTVSSLPGHLVQYVASGRAHHEVGGRHYELEPGSLIWFHEDERVYGRVLRAPWVFYTVNFIAPALSPPPIEARVQRVGRDVAHRFARLLEAWRDTAASPLLRDLRVGARLHDVLGAIATPQQQRCSTDPAGALWWELERLVRKDLSRPVSLASMEHLVGRSRATISRACVRAVNMAPMKRVKEIRLSMAWGLVMFSDLRMKEVADRVGYSRVHEFSRDYHKRFGRPPSRDRAAERGAAERSKA